MRRKRVTMKDIAEKLGLSINAVSLALNDRAGVGEETRKSILDTADQMGYLDQSPQYIQTYSNKNICIMLKHRFFRDRHTPRYVFFDNLRADRHRAPCRSARPNL